MSAIPWDYESDNFISFETPKQKLFISESGCKVQITSLRAKIGQNSLLWEFQPNGSLTFKKEYKISHIHDEYPAGSAFGIWIYNDKPVNKKLRFEFGNKGKVCSFFDLNMNFSGWRTAWVHYKYMQGNAPETIDYFKIIAPNCSGRLFVDAIIPSSPVQYRYPYPDSQVPFNPQGHERSMFANIDLMKLKPKVISATQQELNAAEQLAQKMEHVNPNYNVSDKKFDTLSKRYNNLKIRKTNDVITGVHIYYSGENAIFPEECRSILTDNPENAVTIQHIGKLILDIAKAWHGKSSNEQKKELEKYCCNIASLLIDQGWVEGHARGTVHHLGYQTREFYQGIFLMRKVFRNAKLLTPMNRALMWFNNTRIILTTPEAAIMDYLNTVVKGQLLTCLTIADKNERVAMLHTFSDYLSKLLTLHSNNDEGGFKKDGTSFHHGQHYPAYAFGAMGTTSQIVLLLSKTPFRLSEEAYISFDKAIWSAHIYCNKESGPFAICGRHPMGPTMNYLKGTYLNMALAGTPDNSQLVNPEFASAYLRIWGKPENKQNARLFEQYEINAEPPLSGHWNFNYAGMSIHRRPGWMACIKGYNKWVDASEIYAKDNRWSRNFSNGTIQLLATKGNLQNSGFSQKGWDWNHMPGATIVHLPLKLLECPIKYVQKRSAEIMATGTRIGANGVFGFILNEDGTPLNMEHNKVYKDENGKTLVYGNGLKARKSVFAFDNMLICLGSNISSSNSQYPTETVLFQNCLTTNNVPVWINDLSKPIIKFPFSVDSEKSTAINFLVDAAGNAYYIPGNQHVEVVRQEQKSFYNKIHKGYDETTGNFASAWINHGKSPKNVNYEYVILPHASADKINSAVKEIDKSYQVLEKTKQIHSVYHPQSQTTGYIFFEPARINGDIITEANAPVVVMVKQLENSKLQICLADPDLRCSKTNKSTKPTNVIIKIKGKYNLEPIPHCRVIEQSEDNTTLEFTCQYGETVSAILKK